MLHKEEIVELLRSTVEICQKHDPTTLQINTKVASVQFIVSKLDDALVYEREKEFTKELEDLDRDRDEAVTGLRYGFLMYTYHWDDAIKAAAQKLLNRIDSYGSRIARMNYESESAIIHNFVNDLETEPELKTAIQKIGLQEWGTHLKVANQRFRALYSDRVAKESTYDKTSFTAIKPEATLRYAELINRINAYIELDENDTYTALKKELDTLAERYKQIIATRRRTTDIETEQETDV
jgi:hypothetical protein